MADAINQVIGVGRQVGPVADEGARLRLPQSQEQNLSFSRHLTDRMNRRRLDLSSERIDRLSQAVTKAADKGSRDSVVFLDDLALLVNVPSRTVVTAIDTRQMKDGVFTNIDSVVVG
jgi:flagellar operon protein